MPLGLIFDLVTMSAFPYSFWPGSTIRRAGASTPAASLRAVRGTALPWTSRRARSRYSSPTTRTGRPGEATPSGTRYRYDNRTCFWITLPCRSRYVAGDALCCLLNLQHCSWITLPCRSRYVSVAALCCLLKRHARTDFFLRVSSFTG